MITQDNKIKVCLYCARYKSEEFKVRPLGVSYLASYLLNKGIVAEGNLRIVDDFDEVVEFQPEILGVSSVSQVIFEARSFAFRCKEATGCITILGGYHISSVPFQLPVEFDVGVIGEGEATFAEVVEKCAVSRFDTLCLDEIAGICFRNEDGLVLQTPVREHISDVDSLPLPFRHKTYSREEPIFTSRGCPFRCTYCASQSFWQYSTRFRSADSVVREIIHVVEEYQPDEIAVLDDLWMADKKRFRDIVNRLVDLGIPDKVSFRGFCRSNIMDEESILLLKEMNYSFVRFGAETGSEKLLKRIKGDGISVADHQRVIDLCRKHGMKCGASFMFGIPGETVVDLQETINFLRKNKSFLSISGFYLFNPIPGTVLWEELESRGVVSDDFAFNRLQLDLLRPDFSWSDIQYFNSQNIPLKTFRAIIGKIRVEFVQNTSISQRICVAIICFLQISKLKLQRKSR